MLAAIAMPASADAATVSAANGRITISAAAGETNKMTFNESDGSYQVTDSSAPMQAGAGCTKAPDANRVGCPAGGGATLSADLGDGDDELIVSAGLPTQINAGAGADHVVGGFGDDVIRGDVGDDTLEGNTGNDTLLGEDGNDNLIGGDGDDTLTGHGGNDRLAAGAGNDTLTGANGDDTLIGDAGNDRLEAGKGRDSLDAGAGNDVLLTAEGEFTGTAERKIRCGAGDDSLTAGPADTFVSDCERTDGASLRLRKGGVIPVALVCASSCKGSVRIRDSKNNINTSAAVDQKAGATRVIGLRLTNAEIARLFKQKKVRLTARFALSGGQKVRATFTLLRRV